MKGGRSSRGERMGGEESEPRGLDSVAREALFSSSFLVSELGEIGVKLRDMHPTLAVSILRVQLGHCQTQAHLLETGIALFRGLLDELADR